MCEDAVQGLLARVAGDAPAMETLAICVLCTSQRYYARAPLSQFHNRSDHSGYWHTIGVTRTKTEPRRLRRDAELNRDRVIEAARAAFATDGIDVSVDEIASRAGVGVGTLYRRFPTKGDLVDAVLEDAVEGVGQAAQAALEEDDAWAGVHTPSSNASSTSMWATAGSRT